MGIGGFQRWLISAFPEIVRVQGNRFGEVYDHVAFDLNQILHQAARKASDRHSLAAAVFRELDGILKNCVPRKSIFFAFDGPGPVAKLVTQRKRRSRARFEHVTVPRRRRGKSGAGRAYAVQSIDRLELTPGVDTLYYLRDAIEYWAYTRLQNDRKYTNVEVRISGPDVPGEGELKIIDFCRIGIESRDESVVVVGGDADIVLQGLATTPIRDFFVYLRNFGNHGRKRVNYVLSVWELTRSLERLFPGDSRGARIDFILLSIMNGNDYVPKARGVSLTRLWRRYISLKRENSTKSGVSFKGQFIVDADKRTFNWPLLYRLLERVGAPVTALPDLLASDIATNGGRRAEIVQSEDGDISSEEIVYTGDENGIPMTDMEFSDDEWGDNNSDDDDDDDDDSADASNFDDDDEQHFQTLLSLTEPAKLYDVERWLRMLLWTLQMYVDGHCSDYAFQYGRPYGPSCDLITGFIEDHNGDPFTISAPISNTPPLQPHIAALAMLPKHAVYLLPRPLRRLVTDSETSKRMFPNVNVVDVGNLLHEVGNVGEEEYEPQELRLTKLGRPIWLRLAKGRARAQNFRIEKPGPRFEDVKRFPAVQRAFFDVTNCPRCYPWILGGFRNVLGGEYKRVGGAKLTVVVR